MSLSNVSIHTSATGGEIHQGDSAVLKILNRGGIYLDHETTSKKRLLEQVANLFAEQLPDIEAASIFSTLIERENLGSTGIGHGVALPHGRINGLTEVAGMFLRLQEPLDFDAVDHVPVNLIFAILVPHDATEEHLKLLAGLANVFRDEQTRMKLLQTSDTTKIQEIFDINVDELGKSA